MDHPHKKMDCGPIQEDEEQGEEQDEDSTELLCLADKIMRMTNLTYKLRDYEKLVLSPWSFHKDYLIAQANALESAYSMVCMSEEEEEEVEDELSSDGEFAEYAEFSEEEEKEEEVKFLNLGELTKGVGIEDQLQCPYRLRKPVPPFQQMS
jgi:hypothetical protein